MHSKGGRLSPSLKVFLNNWYIIFGVGLFNYSCKVRFEIYMQDTEPLINFYHSQEKVTKINALGDVDEIYQNIAENLNKYL